MTSDPTMTCIHQPHGLCAACQVEYDVDPVSWHEFGYHAAGVIAWEELQDELAREAAALPPLDYSEIPY